MWVRANTYRSRASDNTPLGFYKTSASSAAYDHPVMQLGGSDVRGVIGTASTGGSPGEVSVTGIGFTPSLILFSTVYEAPDYCESDTSPDTLSDGDILSFSWGACDSNLNQWSGAVYTEYTHDASVRDGGCAFTNDAVVIGNDGFGVQVISMDSDGFTVDSDLDSISFSFVAIELAGNAAVGTFEQEVSTGLQEIDSLGFDPECLWISGNDQTSLSRGWTGYGPAFYNGFVDASESMWDGFRRNDVAEARNLTQVYALSDQFFPYVVNGSGTTLAKATVALITGGFSLDWVTVDGTTRQWGYVAIQGTEAYDATAPLVHVNTRAALAFATFTGGSGVNQWPGGYSGSGVITKVSFATTDSIEYLVAGISFGPPINVVELINDGWFSGTFVGGINCSANIAGSNLAQLYLVTDQPYSVGFVPQIYRRYH